MGNTTTRTPCIGILTTGGTLPGTSRDKPHSMETDGAVRDMTFAGSDTAAADGTCHVFTNALK